MASINWKEILVGMGLPLAESVEIEVEDKALDNAFAKNPNHYKKIIPAAHAALSDMTPLFVDSKIPAAFLDGLLKGIEQSAGECGVAL